MFSRLIESVIVGASTAVVAAGALGACSGADEGDTVTGQGGTGGTTFSTGTQGTAGGAPFCGDGTCQPQNGEGCASCADDCKVYGADADTTTLDAEEQAFLVLINQYRMQSSLGALEGCVSLHRTAQGHSEDMRDNNYFSHDGLDGSQPWDRACGACFMKGCGPMTAMAENIAAGNPDAQATFDQWRNSPPHDANMRNPTFNFIGIGRATGGGEFGVYWTNVFAEEDEPSCY